MSEEKLLKSERKSEKSLTNLCLGLASLGAGACYGYCDAQGIPFGKENTELAITYSPAIIRGSIEAVKGGLDGIIRGGVIGGIAGAEITEELPKILVFAGTGAVAGSAIGTGVGGSKGIIKAGVQTLLGYGIGYAIGYVSK